MFFNAEKLRSRIHSIFRSWNIKKNRSEQQRQYNDILHHPKPFVNVAGINIAHYSPRGLNLVFMWVMKTRVESTQYEEENEKKSRNDSSNYFDKNLDKFLHSGAFQRMEIQNFLQPWWNYFNKNLDKFLHFGAFQRMEIQNFLQPWWNSTKI